MWSLGEVKDHLWVSVSLFEKGEPGEVSSTDFLRQGREEIRVVWR